MVLLDLQLPGMSGSELLVRKSAIATVADIPVAVDTGLWNWQCSTTSSRCYASRSPSTRSWTSSGSPRRYRRPKVL